MSDYIIRATAGKGQIRCFAITARDLAEEARTIHHTSPVVTAALGRLLSAGAMMGAMLKGKEDVLTLHILGDGPVGGLLVTADSKGGVKGYPKQPLVLIPAKANGKLDVSGAIGRGSLQVIMDLGLKEPYSGQVELRIGEIADDLAYYFTISDQIPSAVGLGVLMNPDNTVRQAGGFILQLMPQAEEKTVEILEKNLAGIRSVTDFLDRGDTPEQMLETLVGNLGLEISERIPTGYSCDCSKEKVTKAIISIGEKDIQEMITEKQPIEVKCHFCNKGYSFSPIELEEILNVSANTEMSKEKPTDEISK
jgi:molecular chaperone Hsp33